VTAVPCPLCGQPSRPRFTRPPWEVRRCRVCRVEFTSGDWSPAQARVFYGADYFVGHGAVGYTDYPGLEAALGRTARHRLAQLPAGTSLLEIGCATGTFLAEARERYRVVGTDISVAACQVAARRGMPVVVAEARALPFPAGSFDVVTMWDTIEHLADPRPALSEVARLLRPGGTLALTTGDVGSCCRRLTGKRWHLYTLPEHRYFFSAVTLDRLLRQAGLRPIACTRDGGWYSLAYLVERLAKTVWGSAERVARLLQSSVLRDRMLYVNLFDILLVRARKPEA
jgi:ubiquinone/menaquinone biosynthesis C-methylase UbiE